MKKFIALIIALVIVLSCVGCVDAEYTLPPIGCRYTPAGQSITHESYRWMRTASGEEKYCSYEYQDNIPEKYELEFRTNEGTNWIECTKEEYENFIANESQKNREVLKRVGE